MVKAEQGSSTKTGEKQAALRRELHAQIAAQAPVHSSPGRLVLAQSIFEDSALKKIGCVKSCELRSALSFIR